MVVAPRVSHNKSKNGKKFKRSAATGPPPAPVAPITLDLSDAKATKINLIAMEIKFAKIFAGNNTQISEKQLTKLHKWFQIRSNSSYPFDMQNFLRIWKGLFYSMWMSDKPLPQEQLAEKIAGLVHAFSTPTTSIQFFSAFLQTMSAEWFGIDQWRIDKFMMLVRRMVRQMLRVLHAHDWDETIIELLNAQLAQTVLKSSGSIGFFMHFTELYIDEVAKVSQGEIPVSSVTALVKPFAAFIAKPRDPKLAQHAIKHVFNNLMYQSDMGREYQEKFEAWKELGFPGTSIDELELYEEEDEAAEQDGEEEDEGDADATEEEEEEEKDTEDEDDDEEDDEDGAAESSTTEPALDPRAGRVDVIMPIIQFDPHEIIGVLEEEKYKKYTNVKTRRFISKVVNNYSTFASGKFPLGIQTIKLKSDVIDLPKLADKVNELVNFEKKLYAENEPLKHLNKRNRKKYLAGKEVPLKKVKVAGKHAHTGDCCAAEGHGSPQKKQRRSITSAEKQKIKQWQEEDIVRVVEQNGAADESTDDGLAKAREEVEEEVVVPVAQSRKRKSTDGVQKPAKTVTSPEERTPVKVSKNGASKKASPQLSNVISTPTNNKTTNSVDPWDVPLEDGEVEYSTPSRKLKLKEINDKMAAAFAANVGEKVLNPAAVAMHRKSILLKTPKTPANPAQITAAISATPGSADKKGVKIVLKMNRSQDTSEYMEQLRNSPNTPYDATKKPTKGLLKPNLMPSPINPYYLKNLGLKFD